MYFMYIYGETIIIRPINMAFLDTQYTFTLGFDTGNAMNGYFFLESLFKYKVSL